MGSTTTPERAGGPEAVIVQVTAPSTAGTPLFSDGSVERMLVLGRASLGTAGLAVAPLLDPVWGPGPAIAGLYLIAVSVASVAGLHRWHEPVQRQRLGIGVLAADAVAALAVLLLLGGTPSGAGMLLFPLVAFEATLKLGGFGVVLSAVGLVAGLAGRMAWRVLHYDLPPRWTLALMLLAATSVLVALGYALRARLVAEDAARTERDRIAASLRATVGELLDRAGVPHRSRAYADLEALLELACSRPEVGRELGRQLAATLEAPPDLAKLTPREREVLGLVAEGLSDREVAARLFLSAGTVRVHVSNVVRKLGVDNRAAAVAVLRSRGGRPAAAADEGLLPL